ncbi:MAG: hypothetical protein J7K23_00685 [Thermoproteales archaeon]|nr:hypothetical protein [Thermoproteales archaeon]
MINVRNKLGKNLDIFLSIIIIVAVVLITIYVTFSKQQMIALYILDSNRKTINYPQVIVLNKNNTILFYIGMENRFWSSKDVILKIIISNNGYKKNITLFQQKYHMRSNEKILLYFNITLADMSLMNNEIFIPYVLVNGSMHSLNFYLKQGSLIMISAKLFDAENNFLGQWVSIRIRVKNKLI